MAKVGILGGTFDPVHIAHLYIAQAAKDYLGLDKVVFMPALNPPHKDFSNITTFEKRYEMTRIGIEDNPYFFISDLEGEFKDRKSYTIDTLKYLKEKHPRDELFFIIGLDSLYQLHTWHRIGEIHRYASFVCLTRPYLADESVESKLRSLKEKYHTDIVFLPTIKIDVSSTVIRQAIREGHTVQYLLPRKVMEYIYANNLYRED